MRLLFLLFLALGHVGFSQSGSNSVTGKITLPEVNRSFSIKQGFAYQTHSTHHSSEKKQMDEQNAPDKNIYISLHPISFSPDLPAIDARITQREKTFLPNVVAITKGATVYFLNEDEHYHNIHSLSPRARFNIGRRPPGNIYAQKIDKVGIVKLGCDIHPEMGAIVLSLDTPYFSKIRPDGTFLLSDLPDGEYEIRVFHPAFEPYTDQLRLTGGKVLTKDIHLKIKA